MEPKIHYHILTWQFKARIVEPEEMSVARKWLCKHVLKYKMFYNPNDFLPAFLILKWNMIDII